MGVKALWSVIGGAGQPTDLRSLCGKNVAVDLAGWVVGGGSAVQGHVAKPHLRNLFFRTTALLAMGIKPVFVMDGSAPQLKAKTLEIRKEASQSSSQGSSQTTNLSRSRLKGLMNECAKLLECLGISYIRAEGEAEAYAAQLNAEGLVDAVVTDDSDAFCYGAVTVLRNFAVTGNSAETHTINKLRDCLNLDRRRCVFLAFALGCDFCPQGIPGLGKETLRALLDLWPLDWDPIKIIKMWHGRGFNIVKPTGKGGAYRCSGCKGGDHCDDCSLWRYKVIPDPEGCHCRHLADKPDLLKLETTVKKRCLNVSEPGTFFNSDLDSIVEEFEGTKKLAARKASAKTNKKKVSLSETDIDNFAGLERQLVMGTQVQPKVPEFVAMAVTKLGWTEEYAVEKMTPVLTRWQVSQACDENALLEAIKVCKKRVVGGIPSLLVEWRARCPRLAPTYPDTFESTEPHELVQAHCPALVEAFEESKKKKPAKKTKKAASQPITQFFEPRQKPVPPPPPVATVAAKSDRNGGLFLNRKRGAKKTAVERVKEREVVNSPLTSVALGTPVSSSDLYRRVFLDTPSPSIPVKKGRVCDTSVLDCSEHFVGDLSVILDEIMSNEQQHQSKPGERIVSGFVANSTRLESSVVVQEDQENNLEDTFDRMCQ